MCIVEHILCFVFFHSLCSSSFSVCLYMTIIGRTNRKKPIVYSRKTIVICSYLTVLRVSRHVTSPLIGFFRLSLYLNTSRENSRCSEKLCHRTFKRGIFQVHMCMYTTSSVYRDRYKAVQCFFSREKYLTPSKI